MNRVHPAFNDEHEAARDTMRRFVAREIMPHAAAWDEAGEFPRTLYRQRRLTPAELDTRLRALKDLAAGKLRPSPDFEKENRN